MTVTDLMLNRYINEEPEGNEIRELLLRALVAIDGAGDPDAVAPIAAGLATAYCAFLDASADEEAALMDGEPSDYTPDRGARLSGSELDELFVRTYQATYAKGTGQTPDDVDGNSPLSWEVQDALTTMTLPRGVVADLATILGRRDVRRARMLQGAFVEAGPDVCRKGPGGAHTLDSDGVCVWCEDSLT